MSNKNERTLAIIKPDAYNNGNAGKILDIITKSNFNILGIKLLKLSIEKAGEFYQVHKGKYFYDRLCKFMSSGKMIVLALEAEGAIKKWRDIMGATDPTEAKEGTIRNKYGTTVTKNSVHGSDSIESGLSETSFFFEESELYN